MGVMRDFWEWLGLLTGEIDALCCRLATRCAHALQRTVGPSAFFLVAVCAQIVVLGSVIEAVSYWWPLPAWVTSPEPPLVFVLLDGYVGLQMTLLARTYLKNEESFQRTGQLPLRASLLHTAGLSLVLGVRVCTWLLVVLLPLPPHRLTDLEGVAFFGLFYFGTVVPLPPGPSKVGQWFRSLTAFRMRVPVRVGAR